MKPARKSLKKFIQVLLLVPLVSQGSTIAGRLNLSGSSFEGGLSEEHMSRIVVELTQEDQALDNFKIMHLQDQTLDKTGAFSFEVSDGLANSHLLRFVFYCNAADYEDAANPLYNYNVRENALYHFSPLDEEPFTELPHRKLYPGKKYDEFRHELVGRYYDRCTDQN